MRALLILILGLLLGAAAMMAYVVYEGSPIGGPIEPLPEHPPVTVAFGAPFLEQVVKRAAAEAPGLGLSADDLVVSLREGELVVSTQVVVVGKRTRATIVMRPRLERGQLLFDVASTGIGGMPIPKVGQVIEQHVDRHIRALMKGMPIVVTGAKVDRKRGLVVTGDVDLARLEAALRG